MIYPLFFFFRKGRPFPAEGGALPTTLPEVWQVPQEGAAEADRASETASGQVQSQVLEPPRRPHEDMDLIRSSTDRMSHTSRAP